MQATARSASKVCKVAGAAAAAAVAAPSSSQAYSVPQPELSARRLNDWELVGLDKESVIFEPEAIDAAAGAFLRAAGPSTVITEVEVDTETSDGSYADAVIESEWEGPRLGSCAAGDVAPMETPLVLQVATRLLKRPAVQAEVARAMLEDPEVMAILGRELGHDNLENYLGQTGFAPRGLLTAETDSAANEQLPAEPAAATPRPYAELSPAEREYRLGQRRAAAAARARAAAAASGDPFMLLSLKLADGLEAAGSGLARLGGWMRARLMPAGFMEGVEERKPGPVDRLIGSVMVVVVAVAVGVILRQPALLGRMARFVGRKVL